MSRCSARSWPERSICWKARRSPRTTAEAPFQWGKGEAWKELGFSEKQPWKEGEQEEEWLRKKELYRKLKAEGKV